MPSFPSEPADIFLSYAPEDQEKAGQLAASLTSHGWSVWWDRRIPPGSTFDQMIQKALVTSRCVLVLWSSASVASDWVKEEASEAKKLDKLVPALIEADVPIPMGFRMIQAANLIQWRLEPTDLDFSELLSSLAARLGAPEETVRAKAEAERLDGEQKERERKAEKERLAQKKEERQRQEVERIAREVAEGAKAEAERLARGEEESEVEEVGLAWSLHQWRLTDAQWQISAVAGLGLLLLAGTLVFRPRQEPAPAGREAPVVPARPGFTIRAKPGPATASQPILPIKTPSPSEQEIRALLEAWLKAKSLVLAGREAPALLEGIASPATINRLRIEREQDRARGETQVIDMRVKDLTIRERSPQRIAAIAELVYSDSRRDASGKERESIAPTTLRYEYVFGRDGDTWRLAASSPAD